MSVITVSRDSFITRYESIETRKIVSKSLKSWDLFLSAGKLLEPDILAMMRQEAGNSKYIMLDQFVQFMLADKYVTTAKTYLTYVVAWLRYNDVDLAQHKIKQYVRFPKVVRERTRGVDRDTIKQIVERCTPFYRALILVLASSGMRDKSECLNMEWSWIDLKADPPKITIPAAFTKAQQERITFITYEAREALKAIPRTSGKVFDVTYDGFYSYVKKIRNDLNLTARTSNGRFHFKPHKLRGFCENRLSKAVGEEFAHAIIGHGAYLGQYFAGGTTDMEAANDYKKAIPELTIGPCADIPVPA